MGPKQRASRKTAAVASLEDGYSDPDVAATMLFAPPLPYLPGWNSRQETSSPPFHESLFFLCSEVHESPASGARLTNVPSPGGHAHSFPSLSSEGWSSSELL